MKQPWGAVQINKSLCAIACSVGIGMTSWGCNVNDPQIQDQRWNIYRNKRYGFEFPYPHTWQVLGNPDNSDGVVLVPPNQKNVEIRAYASKTVLKSLTKSSQPVPNFQTHQGFSGVLAVEAGEKVTVIKLTISQENLEYHWQGQSGVQNFQNYYRLFYHMAQEYKISQ
ncbi:hypothetical protein IQ226_00140 [Dolichospermum sp. LEGE 00240]|jgi:hypothetical protein|uniref:hypothetical protein n=1 Tax=Aphanizomenonaceae TaxID=1892259 RepID=UPI0018806560|nr:MULTISPECIES: hypothetical protein [Aphanizomenonaceae]MDM3845400.1 hypothetical protein [Aphanizomenon gracile PMC638.10]MDM3848774.1 hypothetical protein [Aphanizomenon gracile PMC627.10]MDM3854368.1 hypothetical protein [Aphanizomenon gracile PMC649.10]MDM3862365.1 hypothetical protein [Aphanizomenon gracile PMC644.10]MBE9247642.1 hypothetical protein [Dolichospermum sp. LEGE 00240]